MFFIIMMFSSTYTFASEKLIESQMNSLNISTFIEEGEKYTKEVFPDINISEFLTDSLSGNVNNKGIYKSILSILGKEILNTFTLLRWNISNNSNT